jgi:hypothetical protein
MPRHGAWRSAAASAPHRSQPELPARPSSRILSLAWLRADAVTANPRCMDPSDATSATALHAALSGLRPHPSHSRPWSLPCHARTQPATAPLSQSTRTARRRPAGLGLVAVGLPHPHIHITARPCYAATVVQRLHRISEAHDALRARAWPDARARHGKPTTDTFRPPVEHLLSMEPYSFPLLDLVQ